MRKIEIILNEYGESHQNATNKAIHWICVPTIFFTFVGLLYSIKLPLMISEMLALNVSFIALFFVFIYYAFLSWRLSIGMLIFGMLCLHYCDWIEKNMRLPLWEVCLILFVAAWIGQFYGHKIEGRKPSFLKDVQFLLIGPAWLMSFIYRKIGIPL